MKKIEKITILSSISIIMIFLIVIIDNKYFTKKRLDQKNSNQYNLAYKEENGKVLFKANLIEQDSGINRVEYYVSSSSETPSASSSSWTSSNEFSLTCGSIYYVFAKAYDNAGNVSNIQNIDVYPSFCAKTEISGITTSVSGTSCDATCQMNNYASDWHMVNNSNLPDSVKNILKTQLHDFNVKLVDNNNLGYSFNASTGEWKNNNQTTVNDKGANDDGFDVTVTQTSKTRKKIEMTTTEGDSVTVKCKYGRVSATYVNGKKVSGATGESC